MDQEIYTQMSLYEDKHWWFVGRRKIIESILNRFYKNNGSKKILEIGCGTGGNLALLTQYGILTGIELFDEAREYAIGRNICPVYKGSLPDNLHLNCKFDLICLLDVLEHIEDDVEALNGICQHLNKNGQILITVPAFMILWSAHDESHHHKRRYFKKELEDKIIKCGLSIKYSTYFNTILFPIVYLVRIADKIVNRNHISDLNMPSSLVNQILKTIFQLEKWILKLIKFPFGVSILIIAEKHI
ncbi:MAG: class I SAM-dependent methyltransferase [Gammaproteobacteria bacterium]